MCYGQVIHQTLFLPSQNVTHMRNRETTVTWGNKCLGNLKFKSLSKHIAKAHPSWKKGPLNSDPKEEEEKGKLGVGLLKTEGILCAEASRSKAECGLYV